MAPLGRGRRYAARQANAARAGKQIFRELFSRTGCSRFAAEKMLDDAPTQEAGPAEHHNDPIRHGGRAVIRGRQPTDAVVPISEGALEKFLEGAPGAPSRALPEPCRGSFAGHGGRVTGGQHPSGLRGIAEHTDTNRYTARPLPAAIFCAPQEIPSENRNPCRGFPMRLGRTSRYSSIKTARMAQDRQSSASGGLLGES